MHRGVWVHMLWVESVLCIGGSGCCSVTIQRGIMEGGEVGGGEERRGRGGEREGEGGRRREKEGEGGRRREKEREGEIRREKEREGGRRRRKEVCVWWWSE